MIQRLSILYLVCSILILAGLGGFVWYGLNQAPFINSNVSPDTFVNVNEPININQPTADGIVSGEAIPPTRTDCTDELDTECWNTYRNTEYGFEFRYPGGWGAFDCSNSFDYPFLLIGKLDSVDCTSLIPVMDGGEYVFSLSVEKKFLQNINSIRKSKWLDYKEERIDYVDGQALLISNVDYVRDAEGNIFRNNEYRHYYNSYIPYGDYYLDFFLNRKYNSQNLLKDKNVLVYTQVVNSFKFSQ